MNCYLIGEHLAHSCSPEIHRSFGLYEYERKELVPAELGPFLESRAFSGLNVTIPYKQAVIPYLDRLDERAAAIGAVNTVVNRNGVLWGYNTDFDGLLAAIRRLLLPVRRERVSRPADSAQEPPPQDRRGRVSRPAELIEGSAALSGLTVLILGTGGTSRTALAVCEALGAKEIRRVSRTGKEGALTYGQARTEYRHADLILNTTPVGMWPDSEASPLELSAFPRLRAAADVIYNPLRTRLVLEAQARSIPAAGGLEMLVRQAARSCELFTDLPLDREKVDIIYKSLRKDRRDLVLIGMPGAGKTTVGRILAQKTGKNFVDIDEEIARRTGKTIPALFAERGEAFFRDLESDLILELSQSGGKVIACGGGSVLRPENVLRLKQNGLLYFLDRPLEALEPSADRPLGDTAEKIRRLWEIRRPIYLAAADRVIRVEDTPESVADCILMEDA